MRDPATGRGSPFPDRRGTGTRMGGWLFACIDIQPLITVISAHDFRQASEIFSPYLYECYGEE
jgi:hypothetical protein